MLSADLSIALARGEFAMTSIYHFLFVPLILGMPWMLFLMELISICKAEALYHDMARFWGKFFAISFVIDVLADKVFAYEYINNWGQFIHLVGEVFGHFFVVSSNIILVSMLVLFALFILTWDRLGRCLHLIITFLLAIATNLSIINPMVMNSWMQHPVGGYFDYNTMTMRFGDLVQIYTQPLALARIAHMLLAGFLISSMLVLGLSSYYLLKKRNIEFARRSFVLAASFGLATCIFTFISGDANGLAIANYEPEKMAAVEGQWDTQPAPAAWYLIAFPDQEAQVNYAVIKIPYALSLIATHSLSGTVEGIKSLIAANALRIQQGVWAYQALDKLRSGGADSKDIETFKRFESNMGYAMLLKKYISNPALATPAQIQAAALDSVPQVSTVFWTFRIMLACGMICFLVLVFGVYFMVRKKHEFPSWYLKTAMFSIPVPYIAAEAGWILSELGRQPWLIKGILPTSVGASSHGISSVAVAASVFFVLFTLLLAVLLYLIFTFLRVGPKKEL